MRSTNDAAPRRWPTVAAILALTAAAIASALVPMLAGLAFLVSLAARRPLIAVAAERWPWLSGGRTGAWPAHGPRALSRLTAVWGIALLAAGAIQGLGAFTGGPRGAGHSAAAVPVGHLDRRVVGDRRPRWLGLRPHPAARAGPVRAGGAA